MKFREITIADITQLFRVRRATWHNENAEQEMSALGITPESVHGMLSNGTHRGWLCEDGNTVVGFAMGDKTTGEMWVIAVLEEYEGKGIGKKLLEYVENWLWSQGWKEIWLTTDPDEAMRAVGFYRHLGWTDEKVERDRFMKKVKSKEVGC